MIRAQSQHLRLLEILEHLETIRNWLHGATIDELETVEKAIGRKAPILETSEAIALVVQLASEIYATVKMATSHRPSTTSG